MRNLFQLLLNALVAYVLEVKSFQMPNLICKNCYMLKITKTLLITSNVNTEAKGIHTCQNTPNERTRKGGHLAHW